MRFLADHNVEAVIVASLVEAGHDVLTVAEAMRSDAPDHEVLVKGASENRILLTNDKDFGELAFLQGRLGAGILLLRMPLFGSRAKAERLGQILDLVAGRCAGSLVVVTEHRVRRRSLPNPS